MDFAYNSNIRPYLDFIEKYSDLLKEMARNNKTLSKHLEFKFVIIGRQSDGKSSTVVSLTGILQLIGDSKAVTICPIKIVLRSLKKEEKEEYAIISFEDKTFSTKSERIMIEKTPEKIDEYQKIVKQIYDDGEDKIKLYDEVIQVEVYRRNIQNFTLYDLPGITIKNEEIQRQSEKITQKYLYNKDVTVLCVMGADADLDNSSIVRYINDRKDNIPDYKNRLIPVITKVDMVKDSEKLSKFVEQLNDLELTHNKSFIINSDESEDEKERILNEKTEKLKDKTKINKGVNELIKYLVDIQKNNVEKIFKNLNIDSEIEKEISNYNKKLEELPKELNNKQEFFVVLDQCIDQFSKSLEKKLNRIEYNEDGTPKERLMKYHIDLEFRNCIKDIKVKINELFTERFSNMVTHNIIQTNSDNISTLENLVQFKDLLQPEIEKIFEGLDRYMNNIYEYMENQIIPLIDSSIEYYDNLKDEIKMLFREYATNEKKIVKSFFDENEELELESVFTYNIYELISKTNSLNKDINFYLLREKFEQIKENDSNILPSIAGYERGVLDNSFGETVYDNFKVIADNIENLIRINSNYANDKYNSKIENDEFNGLMKISYRPEDISAHYEKIQNHDYDIFNNEELYELVPGFQYICKENLNKFKELIKDGKIEIKTANIITKMVAYLELMLNRNLDNMFMKIKRHLYFKLTNSNMINSIKLKLHLIDLDDRRDLMEISNENSKYKRQYDNNIERLNEAKNDLKILNGIHRFDY